MNSIDHIRHELTEAKNVLDHFIADEQNFQLISKASEMMIESIKKGGKIFSCGNGGSHCDAMHFAEELTGRYREDRDPIAALAISDPSHISCVSNDFGFDRVFSRYIRALGQKGDILLGISTSGNSQNIINAAEAAHQKGMKVISLTGKSGGHLAEHSDIEIRVSHNGYADRIQEIHIKIIHCLIGLIEKGLEG
ncbi:MAG: D-sedoheptulose 7-phosphate isomerase [Cytophagales bacterium]|nr:D-sedoheptulose 7-phosphate isomerase [Hyphobacterium sp. CCMP332]